MDKKYITLSIKFPKITRVFALKEGDYVDLDKMRAYSTDTWEHAKNMICIKSIKINKKLVKLYTTTLFENILTIKLNKSSEIISTINNKKYIFTLTKIGVNTNVMNKKWVRILDIKLLKSDKDKWGLMPIERIKQGFLLKDDSELKKLISFIKSEIRLLGYEIKHNRRWSPLIYHPNAYIAREIEKRSFEIILKRLNK